MKRKEHITTSGGASIPGTKIGLGVVVVVGNQTFQQNILHSTYPFYWIRQPQKGICSSRPSSLSKRLDFPDPLFHLQLNDHPAGPKEKNNVKSMQQNMILE